MALISGFPDIYERALRADKPAPTEAAKSFNPDHGGGLTRPSTGAWKKPRRTFGPKR
jgi:hypothetical protein